MNRTFMERQMFRHGGYAMSGDPISDPPPSQLIDAINTLLSPFRAFDGMVESIAQAAMQTGAKTKEQLLAVAGRVAKGISKTMASGPSPRDIDRAIFQAAKSTGNFIARSIPSGPNLSMPTITSDYSADPMGARAASQAAERRARVFGAEPPFNLSNDPAVDSPPSRISMKNRGQYARMILGDKKPSQGLGATIKYGHQSMPTPRWAMERPNFKLPLKPPEGRRKDPDVEGEPLGQNIGHAGSYPKRNPHPGLNMEEFRNIQNVKRVLSEEKAKLAAVYPESPEDDYSQYASDLEESAGQELAAVYPESPEDDYSQYASDLEESAGQMMPPALGIGDPMPEEAGGPSRAAMIAMGAELMANQGNPAATTSGAVEQIGGALGVGNIVQMREDEKAAEAKAAKNALDLKTKLSREKIASDERIHIEAQRQRKEIAEQKANNRNTLTKDQRLNHIARGIESVGDAAKATYRGILGSIEMADVSSEKELIERFNQAMADRLYDRMDALGVSMTRKQARLAIGDMYGMKVKNTKDYGLLDPDSVVRTTSAGKSYIAQDAARDIRARKVTDEKILRLAKIIDQSQGLGRADKRYLKIILTDELKRRGMKVSRLPSIHDAALKNDAALKKNRLIDKRGQR